MAISHSGLSEMPGNCHLLELEESVKFHSWTLEEPAPARFHLMPFEGPVSSRLTVVQILGKKNWELSELLEKRYSEMPEEPEKLR